jgi:hypothetical protein
MTDNPPADSATANIATYLAGGLVAVTTLLTTLGGLTGGLARMIRNNQHDAKAVFLVAFAAVVLALVAQVASKANGMVWLKLAVLAVSTILFSVSTIWGIGLAVDNSTIEDRPSLSAQLVSTDAGLWAIKGSASTSGLRADERMQVLVYAYSEEDGVFAPARLFYAAAGPNADGVATETFEVPVPARAFDAFAVTANIGDLPRDCRGNAYQAVNDPTALTLSRDFESAIQNSCLTFTPPPPLPTPAAQS